jgi:hypothetical protein
MMKRKASEAVKVVFRVDDRGEVFALLPEIPADVGGRYCACYQHVGQHSGADYQGCIRTSRPAKPAECRQLAAEMRQRGYKIRARRRASPATRAAFDAAFQAFRRSGQ